MAKSLISWVVVGVLGYIWYWLGYAWPYLQDIPRGEWETAWILYTLMAILICRRNGAGSGATVVDAIVGRMKDIAPHLIGLAVSLVVGVTIWAAVQAGGFFVAEYVQAIVVALASGIFTAAWVGALEDASK